MSDYAPPAEGVTTPAPYYSDDLVTLFHGDCREVTTWLDADVLVTDPPYGREWRQGRIKAGPSAFHSRGRHASESHGGIQGDATTEARDQALDAWGNRRAIVFGDLMLPPPKGVKLVGCYRKPVDAGVRGAMGGVRRDLEAYYLIGPWPSGLGGRSALLTTGARCQANPNGIVARAGHPHAKPLDVMSDLIGLSDGTVADPFAGSGSTLVAAKQLGRRAIGVELDERYCEIAAKRLAQDTLFGGVA